MSDKEIRQLRKEIREGKKEMSFLIKLLHEDQLHEYNDWLLQNVSETRMSNVSETRTSSEGNQKLERSRI
jgi:hypothetical protein